MFSWQRSQSETWARYQHTQNTTIHFMENLDNGRFLHFAHLINQNVHRFQDIPERGFFPPTDLTIVSHFNLQFSMSDISVNIMTCISTLYLFSFMTHEKILNPSIILCFGKLWSKTK